MVTLSLTGLVSGMSTSLGQKADSVKMVVELGLDPMLAVPKLLWELPLALNLCLIFPSSLWFACLLMGVWAPESCWYCIAVHP